MLTTFLNNLPYSKFVLIEDSLNLPGKPFLRYIIQSHLKDPKYDIHYFIFEGSFENAKKTLSHPIVEYYDFVSDPKGWLTTCEDPSFPIKVAQISKEPCIIVIDSLVQAIFQCGIATVYKTLHQLLTNTNVVRLIAVLHEDICEDVEQTLQPFEHLTTLLIGLESKLYTESSRVSYLYRKLGGKVIKKIEEYSFENGVLKTEAIKTVDPKQIVQESLNQVEPENLSTFRIGLNEQEKKAREKLVLPYLPKEKTGVDKQEEATIFYQFDETDDWDEEDPDDDLDI